MADQLITIKDFFYGGIAPSEYLTDNNSVSEMVGVNVHDQLGIITPQNELDNRYEQFTSSVVKILTIKGDLFMFEHNGDVWQGSTQMSDDYISLDDVIVYKDYVIGAGGEDVGRKPTGDMTDWSDLDDTWFNIPNSGEGEFTLTEIDGELYVGIDNKVYYIYENLLGNIVYDTEPKLVLSDGYIITDMRAYNGDLLILCRKKDVGARLYRWDTFSERPVDIQNVYDLSSDEDDTLTFIAHEQPFFITSHSKIYYYTGGSIQFYKDIPFNYKTKGWRENFYVTNFKKNAQLNFNGFSLVGYGSQYDKINDPQMGVFTFSSRVTSSSPVITFDYFPDCDQSIVYNHKNITAIGMDDDDRVLIAWKNQLNEYGVDRINHSDRYEYSYLVTGLIDLQDRINHKSFKVEIPYRKMEGNANIMVSYSINYQLFKTLEMVKDEDRFIFYSKNRIVDAVNLKIRIDFIVDNNANNFPEIESIVLNPNI